MKIGFAGSPEVASIVLDGLLKNNIKIELVITTPDYKKRKNYIKSPISEYIDRNKNITLVKTTDKKEIKNAVVNNKIDLMVVVAFGVLLDTELLNSVKYGWINLHYSLLPDLRGAAPIEWAILKGKKITGSTVFKITKGLDSGPIYAQTKVKILDNWNTKQLAREISYKSIAMLTKVINDIKNNSYKLTEQLGEITYAPKITKDMNKIDWQKSSIEIIRQIKALNAFTYFNNKKLNIIDASLNKKQVSDKKRVLHFDDRSEFIITKHEVLAKNQKIELEMVKFEGKKEMPASAWARGI